MTGIIEPEPCKIVHTEVDWVAMECGSETASPIFIHTITQLHKRSSISIPSSNPYFHFSRFSNQYTIDASRRT